MHVPMGSADPGARLRLYRRAGETLSVFFGRWTGVFCSRCLEVTARGHVGELGAAAELVQGRFPGCCQAGVAEALSVPCRGGTVAFPAGLAEQMVAARAALVSGTDSPGRFTLRETASGRLVKGRGCRHLGDRGCRLGALKAPLCLTYLCPAGRAALEDAAGAGCCGADAGDFCGSADALRAVVAAPLEEAEEQVARLEARLGHLTRCLEHAGVRCGQDLLNRWLGAAAAVPENPGRGREQPVVPGT
ncbi:MAG TPA: hypothetical protein VK997_12815 [Deferrisomatales bacterium]|nr:hypothetical protein [Deferrisomatales bacterium]